jgi:leucyl aminopeptidase
MSRELEIEVDPASVERARADVVVVPLFAMERPLRGGAGRADWRLCGKLSALLVQGRLTGAPGEAALLSTFGGLRTPLLLVLGVGERAAFDARRFEAFAHAAVARSLAIRAGALALPLPDDAGGQLAHGRRAAALLAGTASAVAEAPPPIKLRLRLLVPREEVIHSADVLRRARALRLPESVTLRLCAPAGKQTGNPAGGFPRGSEVVPPRGSHLVK